MIYLKLFLTFMKIGAVSFGGGYCMISLIREETLAAGWLTESELMNFIAVAESTPGPVAVNMATFIGSSQGGFLGALTATLGVVLPSFAIILVIAALINNVLKYAGVRATLNAIRPAVAGLVISTAAILFSSAVFGFESLGDGFSFDPKALILLVVISAVCLTSYLLRKKSLSPVLIVIFSGFAGALFYYPF